MLEDGSRELSLRCGGATGVDQSQCCFRPLPSAATAVDPRAFCCRCAHRRRASPLTCLAVCFLVLTYNLLGGFLFLALEGSPAEETAVAASKPNLSQSTAGASDDLRSKTVERLWSITEDLNILYKENWTKLAAKELMDFQRVLIKTIKGGSVLDNGLTYDHDRGDYRWTFTSSFLYALTLITTIGDGNVTPKSPAGKMAAVAYACVGVPIIMLYLSTLGDASARTFRAVYARLARRERPHCESSAARRDVAADRAKCTPFQAALNLDTFTHTGYHWSCREHARVPIALSLFTIAVYVALGTCVFRSTEKWDYVDGCYFSFASLATIGFGQMRPGQYASTVSAKAEDIAVGVCCVYILVGIVVVAMCFNLIQEDAGSALRGVTQICAGRGKSRAVHSADGCDEKVAMSVAS